jgi:hypothetical protein
MAPHAPDPSSSHAARRWSGSTPGPAYRPAGAVYRPRRPTETPLYPVGEDDLETTLRQSKGIPPVFGAILRIDPPPVTDALP